MCKQHALRIAWTIARSIAFLDFRVLRWKFTYDWKCVNTTYRVPLFMPTACSRKGLRLPLRSALFGEGGRDWRPWEGKIKIWKKEGKNEDKHLNFHLHYTLCLLDVHKIWKHWLQLELRKLWQKFSLERKKNEIIKGLISNMWLFLLHNTTHHYKAL